MGQAALEAAAKLPAVTTTQPASAQALARLHMLAAADLVTDADALGRPRPDPDVSARLNLLAQIITAPAGVPAPVVAAVVHGELLSLAPFAEANGIVARGASRLACVATGLDPHNLGVPEVAWLKRSPEYHRLAQEFGTGTPDGLGAWIVLCCEALEAGAAEAASIAEAARPR